MLEAEADRLHKLAQRLNKEGKYEDAKITYKEMYAVEDETLRQAAAVGIARATAGRRGERSGKDEGHESCNTLQPLPPFRRRQTQREKGRSREKEEEEVAQEDKEEEQIVSRALGAVLGSVVGDAAAMGIHWIYAPEELQRLWEARQEEEREKKKKAEGRRNEAEQQKSGEEKEQSAHTLATITTTTTTIAEDDTIDDAGLEFYQPPQSPFFSYPHGRSSPYGEQTILLLSSLHRNCGLDPFLYAQAYARQYGEGWEGYRDASTKGFLRRWYEEGGAREGWRDGDRWGVRDWQANCFTRLPPLVVGFGGGEEEGGEGERSMLRAVEDATRVTQDDDRAVMWGKGAAGVLSRIIFEGKTIEMAIREVLEAFGDPKTPLGERGREIEEERVVEGLKKEVTRAFEQVLFLGVQEEGRTDVGGTVKLLGKNCHLPNSLQTALHAALFYAHGRSWPSPSSLVPLSWTTAAVCEQQQQQEQEQEQERDRREKQALFKRTIRAAIREGGCCASRAGWVGACLGGWLGLECVPVEWRKEVNGFDQIRKEVEEIIRHRRRRRMQA